MNANETDAAAAVHRLDPSLRQRAIDVHLAGAGGTGSQMLTGLARLHLALLALGHPGGLRVTVWDPDRVSVANVGRQLFSPSDVGQSKAVTLVTRINCYFGMCWKAFGDRYDGTSAPDADLIITCVDTAKARRAIAGGMKRSCADDVHLPYWLDCGNARQTGQVMLTQGGEGAGSARLPGLWDVLPRIFDAKVPEDDTPSCSLAEALGQQDLFINQMIATWALHLLWRLLSDGQTDTMGYWINLAEGYVSPVPVIAAMPGCKAGTKG
jgi:PRTRC genetic system ThiF family protein